MITGSQGSDFTPKNTPYNKAIFLEVDGVLKTDRFGLNLESIANIKRLVEGKDTGLVLFSDHGQLFDDDLKPLNSEGRTLSLTLEKSDIPLIGKAISLKSDMEEGIKTWLSEHENIRDYVIFGDCDIGPELGAHYVPTNPFLGVRRDNVLRAKTILNIEEERAFDELEDLP